MTLAGVKALTFDTGGTIFDWHTGFRATFEAAGGGTASTATEVR